MNSLPSTGQIIRRCRAKVGTRSEPAPTTAEIDHGVPMFLDQLLDELRHGPAPDDFRTLNRCLDDAIAGAVTEYGRDRDRSTERDDTFEGARREMLARDLLKAIDISKFAFEAIRAGRVGVTGSTGTVLTLALDTANDLAERLLAETLTPGCTAGADTLVSEL